MPQGWLKLVSGSSQRERTEVMRQVKGFGRHNQVIDAYMLAHVQNTLCLLVSSNSSCLFLKRRNTEVVFTEC